MENIKRTNLRIDPRLLKAVGVPSLGPALHRGKPVWAAPSNKIVFDRSGRLIEGKELLPPTVFLHGDRPVISEREFVFAPRFPVSFRLDDNHPMTAAPCLRITPLVRVANKVIWIKVDSIFSGGERLLSAQNMPILEMHLALFPGSISDRLHGILLKKKVPAGSGQRKEIIDRVQNKLSVVIDDSFDRPVKRANEQNVVGRLGLRFGKFPVAGDTDNAWISVCQLVLYPKGRRSGAKWS